MVFPQVDLPVNMIAWTDVTEDILNLYKQSCRIKACIFALCIEGSLKATINLMDLEIKKGDFIVLMPGTIIQMQQQQEKLKLGFIGFSSQCVNSINLIQTIKNSFSELYKQPIISLNPTISSYFKDYFSLWARITTGPYKPDDSMAQMTLRNILTCIERLYSKIDINPQKPANRQEEICQELVRLIIDNYLNHRDVNYYAEKIGITPQHLSTTVKQNTGHTVMDIIAHVVLVDAKSKLKATSMTIQQIAYSLNFPNASFFSKYFKRYVGMSPLEFRNS